MIEYHKIQTVFKRNLNNNYKTLLEGEYSIPEFEYLKDNIWIFTEKIDGTNIRVMWDGNKIAFGGKTDNAQIPLQLINRLKERFLLQEQKFIDKFGNKEVCLYGEGYGAKIQKAGVNYRQDQDFILFDIKIERCWLKREDIEDIANFFGLDVVPIIGKGTLNDMVEKTRKGFNSIWGNFTAEGIVARPEVELLDRLGNRIITKIKYKDFTKYEDN